MKRLAFVVAVLLGAGCSEATPPKAKGYLPDGEVTVPPPPPAMSCDAAALDDADAGAEDAADAGDAVGGAPASWTGTWTFVSGSQGLACGGSLSVVAVSGFLEITEATSGTKLTVVEDGCTFHFDLSCSRDVATVAPGQSCSAWAIPMIPSWTLALQPDGTLHETLGGRVLIGGDVCTISGGSTLVRE